MKRERKEETWLPGYICSKGIRLSCDPATAAYPAGWGNVKPGPAWFKLGFPLGYVADILQNVTVLCELGFAKDARHS